MKKFKRIVFGLFLLAVGVWLMNEGSHEANIIIGAFEWLLGISLAAFAGLERIFPNF